MSLQAIAWLMCMKMWEHGGHLESVINFHLMWYVGMDMVRKFLNILNKCMEV